MDNKVLQIVLQAKDEASAVLKQFQGTAKSVSTTVADTLKNNVVQLGAAFAATSGFIYTSIGAYEESQKVTQQLNAVLESTKGVAGVTKDAVLDLASALQQQTQFSDEAVVSAENMLLTFTNIKSNIFPEATKTVLDMSVALGQDTKNSAIQLGKALQDPILGVTALRRVGVAFTEEQRDQIKTLVESGQTLKAQQMILKELATEFGGSATAQAKTFTGQMIILKNNVNDLQETMGKGFVDTITSLTGGFENVNKAIKNFNDFLKNNKDVVIILSAAILGIALVLGGLLVAALVAAAGAAAVFIGIGAAIVAVLVGGAALIALHWNQLSAFFQGMVASVQASFAAFGAALTTFFQTLPQMILTFITTVITFFDQLPLNIMRILGELFFNWIPYAVGFMIGYLSVAIPQLVQGVVQWFSELPPAIWNIITQVYNFIVSGFSNAWAWISKEVSQWVPRIIKFLFSLPAEIGKILTEMVGTFTSKLNEAWGVIVGWKDKVVGAFNAVANAVRNAINAINEGIKAGIRSAGGGSFQHGGFVQGAYNQAVPALLHGGERVTPRVGTDVNGGGGVGTANITIAFTGPVSMDSQERIDDLANAILNRLNRQNELASKGIGV